jgi:hypothetical protein
MRWREIPFGFGGCRRQGHFITCVATDARFEHVFLLSRDEIILEAGEAATNREKLHLDFW